MKTVLFIFIIGVFTLVSVYPVRDGGKFRVGAYAIMGALMGLFWWIMLKMHGVINYFLD